MIWGLAWIGAGIGGEDPSRDLSHQLPPPLSNLFSSLSNPRISDGSRKIHNPFELPSTIFLLSVCDGKTLGGNRKPLFQFTVEHFSVFHIFVRLFVSPCSRGRQLSYLPQLSILFLTDPSADIVHNILTHRADLIWVKWFFWWIRNRHSIYEFRYSGYLFIELFSSSWITYHNCMHHNNGLHTCVFLE